MKTFSRILSVAVLCSTLVAAHAQPGAMRGPQFGGSMAKLFGDNSAFSATVEMQMKMNNQDMTMPGKISFDSGKSRFEMSMSEAKGGQLPPEAAAHMKAMGMDRIVSISLPDKNAAYMIYPDMQAYAEMQSGNSAAAVTNADKVEITELGKETLDGHPCVKNKAIVTDDKNARHEYTVWNATDLKKFPVKIETTEQGHQTTILFKDVKFAKPDASLFTPPSDYQKYGSAQELMQTEMMKRMGGGGMGGMGGMPPGHP